MKSVSTLIENSHIISRVKFNKELKHFTCEMLISYVKFRIKGLYAEISFICEIILSYMLNWNTSHVKKHLHICDPCF